MIAKHVKYLIVFDKQAHVMLHSAQWWDFKIKLDGGKIMIQEE